MKSADRLSNHVNALEALWPPGFRQSLAAAGSSLHLITLVSTDPILCGTFTDL